MSDNRTLKRDITVGVVVTLITLIVLEPLYNWAWPLVLALGEIAFKGLIDQIYKSAALGNRDANSFMTLALLLSVGLGGMVSSILVTLHIGRKKRIRQEGDLDVQTPRVRKLLKIASLAVITSTAFATIYMVGSQFAELQIRTSFFQRLTVLTPSISNHERDVFAAQWASMKGRADYEAINKRLEDTAAEQGVILPAPLLE